MNVDFVAMSPQGDVPLAEVAIILNPQDNVAIAKSALRPGTTLLANGNGRVPVRAMITSGHKIALAAIPAGAPIRRYGQIIGFASQPIAPGDHVHVHNVELGDFERDYAFGVDARPVDYVPEAERREFMGFRRPDGRVGTRNYIAVISSVNCSGHTVKEIAHHFTMERLADFPNVDGVIPLAHTGGCACAAGGEGYVALQRVLAGMAQHPNVAGYILVGLGCETNQLSELIENHQLDAPAMAIQNVGGIRKTIEAGIEAVSALLPAANAAQRAPHPVSELMVALQCGGSDSWSGVTANPMVGIFSDMLVRQGGTVVLGETTEVYGAEPMLTRRAISREVGEKFLDLIRWWEDHVAKFGISINNNPSAGNKAGGLTTIYEKSLGAAAKGGSTPLTGVFDYAERVTARGFTHMDTPGYDPVGVTGQVAGGCNLVLFTTGRGSAFGFKPAPSIKIATNSDIYNRMPEDMDLNAGQIVDGVSMEDVAAELFELAIRVASGEPTKSEAQGVGEHEFVPWQLGGTL